MVTLSLLLSLVALAISGLALWRVSQIGDTPIRAPNRGPVTLTGSISINNDCDGQQGSIPAQVIIETDLSNAAGNIKVPGRTVVNMAPDPANPTAPVKIGTYTITVLWPGGAASHWVRPKVLNQATALPVCDGIAGCQAGRVCRDLATATRTVPFDDPTTNHDIRISCSCTTPTP